MDALPGRELELSRLERAWSAARAGRGGLVLVTGEAGVGKSRLVAALVDDLAPQGVAVARTWCPDDPGAPSLWPWRRAARDVPGLAAALADVALADDDAVLRLADAVAAALAGAAGTAGLVLVLEDLHWADSLSLDLLRRVVPELAAAPVLVVATARDEGVRATPYGDRVPDLLRLPSVVHVALDGLDAPSVVEWLAADPATAAWVARAPDLVERTGGNPFLVRSLVAELPAPGALPVGSAGPWASTVEDDVARLLAQRSTWRSLLVAAHHRLPDAARRTTAVAAVLGERLAPSLLARALDRPVAEVSEHLAAAVSAGVLRFGPAGLVFQHALVRDAVVADLAPAERTAAHAAVAAALEESGEPLLAGVAALHWSRVEGREAAQRCRTLADQALAATVLAPDRGVELATAALGAARTLGADDAELAERLLVLARHHWSAGRLEPALDACREGVDRAEAVDRPDLVAELALVPQGVGSFDVAQVVGQLGRRALGRLPAGDDGHRARLLAVLAVGAAEAALTPARELAGTAERWSEEALQRAEATGDPQTVLEVVAARHFVLSYPQAVEERAALTARALELAPSATTTMGALWGLLWRADLAAQRGDLVGVRQTAADIDRVAAERSSPVARWHALRLRSGLAALEGRFDPAREHAAQARVIADRVGDVSMIGMHLAFHVQLALLRGDPGDVLPGTLEVLRLAPEIPLVQLSLPAVHALLGDVELARAELAPLRDLADRMPLGPRWAGTVGQLGLVATLVDDADLARRCHDVLAPCARWYGGDGGGSPFLLGSTHHQLGLLARTAGDLPAARDHLATGIELDRRIGATPYVALGRLGLAETLDGLGDPGAAAEAAAALRELDALDLPGPLARASALCDRLAAAAAAAAPDAPAASAASAGRTRRPGGLSERELEVAGLVGRALTNQQIADRLVLSVRTVESHVSSVLTKLGLTTRTEVAVWVREHGS